VLSFADISFNSRISRCSLAAPIITAAGIGVVFVGLLLAAIPVAVAGGLVAAGGLIGWFHWNPEMEASSP